MKRVLVAMALLLYPAGQAAACYICDYNWDTEIMACIWPGGEGSPTCTAYNSRDNSSYCTTGAYTCNAWDDAATIEPDGTVGGIRVEERQAVGAARRCSGALVERVYESADVIAIRAQLAAVQL